MIKYFATHPTAANLIMIIFLVVGLMTVNQLKREAMPDSSTETVQISASYSGATAEEIEEALALPIEEALSQLSDIKSISTSAMEGSVSVRVEMADGANFQDFYNDIKTQIDAIHTFPSEVENVRVSEFNRTDQVVSIAVYGNLNMPDLKAYCEQLKKKFSVSASGALVELSGFSQREFRISLKPEALIKYKISISDVASLIRTQNKDLPSGTLKTDSQDIKIRFNDRRKTKEDLEEIRLRSGVTGAELKLKDIATITDQFISEESKTVFDGKNSAVISISKSKAADSLTIYNKVMNVLNREKATAPKGIYFKITRDTATEIQDRLNMVMMNAVEGAILVFLALWLFLNIKLSIWVTMGLPTSFLGGLFVLYLLDISLNMVSTFALLIALGLLMDDAIVLSENIAKHLQQGKTSFQAAMDGVKEVAGGVLSSYATTICVFAPLMFLSGMIGKIICVVPLTLIVVLTISLFEAFFILPNHLAHSFAHGMPKENKIRKAINAGITFVQDKIVGTLVGKCVKYRYIVVAISSGLFIFSIALFPAGYLKFVVFPQTDGDTVVCRVQLAPGTPLSISESYANLLCEAAKRANEDLKKLQPNNEDLIRSISVTYSSNSDVRDSGAHLFTVYLDLLSGNTRSTTIAETLAVWRKYAPEIPGALSVKYSDMSMGPGGKAIEIRLQGDNLDDLKKASEDLRIQLAKYAGVTDISDNLTLGKPEIVLKLKSGSLKLGLTASAIAAQLRASYQGEKADEVQIGTENYQFNVRMADDLAENQHRFDNFRIITSTGKAVPLSAVAEFRSERGVSSINRYNRNRTVTVSADVNTSIANSQEITSELNRVFLPQLKQKYAGISFGFGGQREASSETGSSLARAFILGIFGIYFILSLQFRSWSLPIIIMFAIPLSIIGTIWGHIFYGMAFNMQSLVGVISLAGIVVNDSILMIEFIRMRHEKGEDPQVSAEMAARDRFRALMLTSITTIAGLLPILSETSLQAQMIIPLALSIVCGLCASTILVLLVIPPLYMVIKDFQKK